VAKVFVYDDLWPRRDGKFGDGRISATFIKGLEIVSRMTAAG